MIDRKLAKSFNNMLYKLDSHPALPSTIITIPDSIWYSLQEVCKNGYSDYVKQEGIAVWYNPKNYTKYKTLFDAEFKKYDVEDKRFTKINIPYKDYFGVPWEFDRCEYWGETCFYIFRGTDYSKWFDRAQWDSYSGPECSASSYEELVIKLGKLFLKNFGNKKDDDFLTVKEIANHKKYNAFIMDRETSDKKGHYLDPNPKYIKVNQAELNHRWLKEYFHTEHCQKNWKSTVEEILKNDSKTKNS